jgi:hypothetical protein
LKYCHVAGAVDRGTAAGTEAKLPDTKLTAGRVTIISFKWREGVQVTKSYTIAILLNDCPFDG